MAKFKFHVLDHQYNIMDFETIECRYDELLQKAKIYLDEYTEKEYSSSILNNFQTLREHTPDSYILFLNPIKLLLHDFHFLCHMYHLLQVRIGNYDLNSFRRNKIILIVILIHSITQFRAWGSYEAPT